MDAAVKRVLGRMNVGLAQQWMAKLEEKCRIGSDERKENEKRSRRPPPVLPSAVKFQGISVQSNYVGQKNRAVEKKKPTSQCDKEAVETQPKRFAQTYCG